MIKIIDNIYLDADDNCYIVMSWDGKRDKKGHIVNADRHYYSDLSAALLGVSKMKMRRVVGKAEELNEVYLAVREMTALMREVGEQIERCGLPTGDFEQPDEVVEDGES